MVAQLQNLILGGGKPEFFRTWPHTNTGDPTLMSPAVLFLSRFTAFACPRIISVFWARQFSKAGLSPLKTTSPTEGTRWFLVMDFGSGALVVTVILLAKRFHWAACHTSSSESQ